MGATNTSRAAGRALDSDSIDAVYPWVDGSSPAFQQALSARAGTLLPPSEAVAPQRFRDHGELRYALRSLERYAPWVRRVFIICAQAPPAWLNLASPRLQVVAHEQIFDGAQLPTFNGAGIATRAPSIPGLARRFLYFNDDVFLGRPARPADFFRADGQPRSRIVPLRRLAGNDAAPGSAFTAGLLERGFGPRPWRDLPHGPAPMALDAIERAHELWGAELRATASHPFRDPDDARIEALLYALAAEALPAGRLKGIPPLDRRYTVTWLAAAGLVMPGGEPAWVSRLKLRYIRLAKPLFFCINDSGEAPSAALNAAMDMLRELFPTPSEFEISAPPG